MVCTSAGASVTHEHVLETCEPSCVPRVAKHFFISVVHSSPGAVGHVATPELPSQEAEPRAVGHVAAPELPSQEDRAQSHGICGSTGAHLVKEVRTGAKEHVAASELTSARRRGPGPRDTCWCRIPPLQGGVIQSYNLCGSVWMHTLLIVLT
jgi:hypothetical protein